MADEPKKAPSNLMGKICPKCHWGLMEDRNEPRGWIKCPICRHHVKKEDPKKCNP